MKHTLKISTCLVAAIALSGCQNVLNAFNLGSGTQQARADTVGDIFGEDDLEQGRLALKANAPGNAIKYFRVAALNQDTAAEAFNGLGVAYARLGRADLAERYFKMAVTIDAANPRYAANLSRFYASDLGNSQRALAMRAKEAETMLAQAERAAEAQGLTETPVATETRLGSVTITRPAVRLQRSSTREIALSTMPGSATEAPRASQMAVAVRNPRKPAPEAAPVAKPEAAADTAAETEQAKPKPVRVSVAGQASGSAYPVRIAISGKPAASAKASQGGYPVRVAITSPSSN